MKRSLKKGISLFLALVMMTSLFAGLPQVAFADSSWQMVGNDCFSAGNYFPISMALDSSDTPYIAFTDETQGFNCTVMKLDGGSWVPVGNTGFTTSPALYPSLVIDGTGTPYVAYQDPSNEKKSFCYEV